MSQYGRAAVPPAAGSVFVLGIVAVVGAFLVAQGLTNVSYTYTMGAVAALILFALAFVRTDWGIYIVIFSMLLSPQFGSKGTGVGAGRGVTFRTEDFVLLVIGLATRFSALGILVMTGVIQLVVPEGWANFHLPWAALAVAIIALGPGTLSLDHLIDTQRQPWIREGGV